MKYSFKDFFKDLYHTEGQKFAYTAKSEEEFSVWKERFRKGLSTQLGLERLERIGKGMGKQEPLLLEEAKDEGFLQRQNKER